LFVKIEVSEERTGRELEEIQSMKLVAANLGDGRAQLVTQSLWGGKRGCRGACREGATYLGTSEATQDINLFIIEGFLVGRKRILLQVELGWIFFSWRREAFLLCQCGEEAEFDLDPLRWEGRSRDWWVKRSRAESDEMQYKTQRQ
jgi:hypothetical protein